MEFDKTCSNKSCVYLSTVHAASGYSNLAYQLNVLHRVVRPPIMDNVLQAIGNTPLVRMNTIPAEEGLECEIRK